MAARSGGSVRDLGALTGPVLVFGGPLSNVQALRALLGEANRLAIPDGNLICTGDVAGYGADAEACFQLLRARAIATVMGNVEQALGDDDDDCGCNFVAGSTCDALAGAWYNHARRSISGDSRAWAAALPRRIRFSLAGFDAVAIHGGARAINRYVFASDLAALGDEAGRLAGEAPVVIAGHAGLPFTRRVASGVWHNPGALGLPANDGTARVWYGLITPVGGKLDFAHIALAYDQKGAAAAMREAGLPEPYTAALETGLWPDTAILPEAEKGATGRPLRPALLRWPG